MEMAIDARLTAAIIKTNCIEVVNVANNRTNERKDIALTISDIQSSKANFQSVIVQHILRCCKRFAHSLAKRALRSSDSIT